MTTSPPDQHVNLARRFDGLHQLLYSRGGIKPSNAAVEELTKLLFLRIAAEREPAHVIEPYGRLGEIMNPETFRKRGELDALKACFQALNNSVEFTGEAPSRAAQGLWPADEPLRISRLDVAAEALDIVSDIPVGTASGMDSLGTAFDVFLRGRYEHGGGLGTYLTPHTVVQSMVRIGFELANPVEGWDGDRPVMGDPCCGSGRFLVGLVQQAASQMRLGELDGAVLGTDQSESSVAMAQVNMLGFGLQNSSLFRVEDSITDEYLDGFRGRLRLILTNPPFGDGKYDSIEGIQRTALTLVGLAGKSRIDPALAFVARCLELLAPGGVAGIILPDGVLDGPAMRELLLGPTRVLGMECEVEGVISLPSATFAPAGTTAKTSVLFLRNGARQSQETVFLARADHVGYVMKKGSISPDPKGDDLPDITDAVLRLLRGVEGVSSPSGTVMSVGSKDLLALDASSIDEAALEARRRLLDGGGRVFSTVMRDAGRKRVELSIDLPFISVLHVDLLGNVDWCEANEYRPTTPGIEARGGDILISLLNPSKFRATVVPRSIDRVQCSAEFGVFRASEDPYAVLALLQHPDVLAQLAPLGRGTSSSRRRIVAKDVLGIVAPAFESDGMHKLARVVSEALAAVAEARSALRDAYGRTSDDG